MPLSSERVIKAVSYRSSGCGALPDGRLPLARRAFWQATASRVRFGGRQKLNGHDTEETWDRCLHSSGKALELLIAPYPNRPCSSTIHRLLSPRNQMTTLTTLRPLPAALAADVRTVNRPGRWTIVWTIARLPPN